MNEGMELAIFSGLDLNKPPEGDYANGDLSHLGGKQLLAEYPNGYGASVITSRMSYGSREGKYEMAVLHGEDQQLCYASPVTGDVIGWLEPPKVIEKLHEVAALERNDACNHGRPDDIDYFDHDEDEGRASIFDALDSLGRSF